MTQEELNQMAAQMQGMQQQAQQMASQLDAMQASADEMANAIETLKNIKDAKSRVLLPIGAGVYASAKNMETQKVLVNIGAGIVDERPVGEAVELLEKRMKLIISAMNKGQESLAQLSARMESLDGQARRMISEMNANVRAPEGETV